MSLKIAELFLGPMNIRYMLNPSLMQHCTHKMLGSSYHENSIILVNYETPGHCFIYEKEAIVQKKTPNIS